MPLPSPVALTDDHCAAIARLHNLPAIDPEPLPSAGVINMIYRCGDDLLLRVPRDHPGNLRQARAEALVAPAARAAGVCTPRMVVYDDSGSILPVPYCVVERVRGATLGLLDREPGDTPAAWCGLGHDLALLHTRVSPANLAGTLRSAGPPPDPRVLAEERGSDGWFTGLETRWLTAWLDRIAPAALVEVAPCCIHQDVQATNIMVRDDTLGYLALLDWGCAAWGDPAWDFFGMPLRAVPTILAGYREVAPLPYDEGAEVRILWRHLQMSLLVLPRGAAPGLSWGERPVAWLLEVMRFFFDAPGGRWRDLRP